MPTSVPPSPPLAWPASQAAPAPGGGRLVALAGNIGAGKTTLAGHLERHMGYRAFYEDPATNPYIVDFYANMPRWAFQLQVHFLQDRLRQLLDIYRLLNTPPANPQQPPRVVQDRTLYEDAEIFTPNLLDLGLMSQREFATYQRLYQTAVELVPPPDLLIYLQADIPILTANIAERNRDYEDNLRIDYLRRLNQRYDAWFDAYDRGEKLLVPLERYNFREQPDDLGKVLGLVRSRLDGLF